MKKKNVIIISVVGLIVLATILFFFLRRTGNGDYTLETTTMKVEDIHVMVTATGTVEPVTTVEVGTQVSGIIDKIFVDYNSVVVRGQVLAELDKITLQSDLTSKEMELNAARVEYEFQQTNMNRYKGLFDQQLISQLDYETAKYNYDKAESSYRRLTADLVKARTNLGYATITSPIDGVVLSRAVEEGQTVAASFNTPTLFTIANDLTKMQVVANVDEADIGDVREGQSVTFTVDAYPMDIFQGTVTQVRLEAIIESNVVTYEVIINAPNPDLKLKPGLTANVTIYTLQENSVDVLPNKAMNYQPNRELLEEIGYNVEEGNRSNQLQENERAIWVVNGNAITEKTIVPGETDGVNTKIISGLTPTDKVVTGLTVVEKKNANGNGNVEQSPFAPQRPGGRR